MNRESKIRKNTYILRKNNPDTVLALLIYDGVSAIFKYRVQSTAVADEGTNFLSFIHPTNSIWQTY